jgi:hypothetical protein
MAYTRAMNAATQFGDPLILSVVCTASTNETNVPIYVPWDNVDLTYAYVVLTTIIDTGNCQVDLEDGAGGTDIGNVTIVESGCAVGDVTEVTLANPANRKNLLNSDTINIEIDGASGNGQFIVYMYFEPSEYA